MLDAQLLVPRDPPVAAIIIVILPAIGIRRHRLTLTDRPGIRPLPMPAIYRARRAAGQAHTTPAVALTDADLRTGGQAGWSIASVALMIAVVLMAWMVRS
jgi:hypothetical protein